jgi:NAD(P)H-dependent FMN reductase
MKPSPWTGLPVLLCAASPGAFGGARALITWRTSLANMGALAFPEAITVPHADQQLDGNGAPTNPFTASAVPRILDAFLSLVAQLKSQR